MAKQSNTVHKKSRGRPAGKTYSETIPARLEPATLASLDAWAVANDVSRSEAIRRLVEIGLAKSSTPKRPRVLSTAKQGAERAAELAADVIGEQMPNTSDEEKTTRRRRLIKGPSEFRTVRRDRPQRT
jgi:hypothetical protein